MSDYMPVDVVIGILKRLPVKSLVRCRSVCKRWNTLICDPSFISTHLQFSLSKPPNNTPFLLILSKNDGKQSYSLHYDNDGFDKFKQLQFPPFDHLFFSPVVGSCNGLLCVRLSYNSKFVIWNPSIQKYISFPKFSASGAKVLNAGFGYDSRTDDYKLLAFGVKDSGCWIQPYLFSLNGNCWKSVGAVYRSYGFSPQISLPFVNGALHWLGCPERNNCAILGFDLSVEEFFEIKLPESLFGLSHVDLSIMKYGESSIAVTARLEAGEFHELWVMKEYGVVDSWTKVLTLPRDDEYLWASRILGFRKNGEVLLKVDNEKMASHDLNCQQMEFHGVEVGGDLGSVSSYIESLVLLDKAVNVRIENVVNHPIDSSDLV